MSNVVSMSQYSIDKMKKVQQRGCSWAITKQERKAIRYSTALGANIEKLEVINAKFFEEAPVRAVPGGMDHESRPQH